jgi:hypothetical protein
LLEWAWLEIARGTRAGLPHGLAVGAAHCCTPGVTRRRAAVVLLPALLWCVAAPCLGMGPAPATRDPVVSTASHAEAASTWLPRTAAAEQLARLSEHDAGRLTPAADAQEGGERWTTLRHRGSPPPRRRAARRRALWRRRARATDEPS